MGLKDDIVANLSKAVKAIQVIQESSRDKPVVFRNSHRECHELMKHLDRAFLHRRRHVRNGYWKIVAEFTPKVSVLEIIRLRNVTSDLGRGRACLFMVLNNCLLESYIHCFQQNQKLMSKYYVRDALVRDQERLNILLTLAAGLENAVFSLEMDMPYLDLCTNQPKSYSLYESSDQETIVLGSNGRVVYTRHSLPGVPRSVNNISTVSSDTGRVAYKDTCLLRPQRKQYSRSLSQCCNSDAYVPRCKDIPTEYEGDFEREARLRRIEALMNSDDSITDGSSEVVVTYSKYRHNDRSKACNTIKIQAVNKASRPNRSQSKSARYSDIQIISGTKRPLTQIYSDNPTDSNKAGSSARSIKSGSILCGSTIDGENSVETIQSSMKSLIHCELNSKKSNEEDNKIFMEQLSSDQKDMITNVVSEPATATQSDKRCIDSDISKVKTDYKSLQKPTSSDFDYDICPGFTTSWIEPDVQCQGDSSHCCPTTGQLISNPVCLPLFCDMEDIYTRNADHEEEIPISTMQTSKTTILKATQALKEENKSCQSKAFTDSEMESFASQNLTNKEPTEMNSFDARLKTSSDQTELKKYSQLVNAYSDDVQLTNNFTNKTLTDSTINKQHNPSMLMNSFKLEGKSSSQSLHKPDIKDINVAKLANENLSTEISALHIHNRDGISISKPISGNYFNSVRETDDPAEDGKLCPGEVRPDIHCMLFLMLDVLDTSTDEKFMKMFGCLTGHPEGETRVIFLLISSRSLYLLTQERKDGKFTKEAVVRFPEIDFVSLGMNYQFVLITCKNRNRQYCLSTGDEMSTRAIVHCLVSAMENDYHPIRLTVDTEATTQRATFRKYIANESKCDSTEVKLHYYALVHWEGPQTCRGRAGSSEREGYLLYKPKTTSDGLPQSNTWFPAYAVLRDCMLWIYNDQNDLKAHTCVNLAEAECVGCKLDLNSERPHSIKILLASGDFFWLSMEMEIEVSVWLQSLCQALAEGLQNCPARTSCLPFCLIMTSQKLLMCHENLQTLSVRTMGNASLEDITAVLTDSTMKTFCVLEFRSQKAMVSSEKWVFYFSSENEANKFLQALSACWSERFQMEIPLLPLEDIALQRKCREMAMFLKNELKPKPVQ
ncbi:hypothetical protein ACJMK2_013843 [Sinanodonta woodiana]|uniref:Pleckstrin homology domain-containing family M member 2 n=1 Tax=Sinanodonta woodiana TaxID=1069815 RepID=A0ABD3UYR0_SINWO